MKYKSFQFSHSVMSDSLRPHGLQHAQASLSVTNSKSLLKLMSIKLVMPSNSLIVWWPLLLLPSVFPSIRVFSSKSVLCIRWPKYWSFSFSIGPSNKYSGLISLRIDLIGSPHSPRDSQESSLTAQFKTTNSSALSLLYGPTLTSVCNYWKNHSFDQTDLYFSVYMHSSLPQLSHSLYFFHTFYFCLLVVSIIKQLLSYI